MSHLPVKIHAHFLNCTIIEPIMSPLGFFYIQLMLQSSFIQLMDQSDTDKLRCPPNPTSIIF